MKSIKNTNKILVIGDSHVTVFRHINFGIHMPNYFFDVRYARGATISGIKNPNSLSQSHNIFEEHIVRKDYNKVIMCIGEVDFGFIIWYKYEVHNIPIVISITKAIENYKEYILKLKDKLIIISTPFPTECSGVVGNIRSQIKTPLWKRRALSFLFNSIIRDFCNQHSVPYVNLDVKSTDISGNVIDELLSKDIYDHHYDQNAYSKMIISELTQMALLQ